MAKAITVVGTSEGSMTVTNPENQGIPVIITNLQDLPSGGGGGGAVDSVNGKIGAVVLAAADIKTSVNGGNWNVDIANNIMWGRLDAHDDNIASAIEANYDTNIRIDDLKTDLEDNYTPTTYVDAEIDAVNTRIDNLPSGGGAVSSVNEQVGDVWLDATNIWSGYYRPVEEEAGYTIFEELEIMNSEIENLPKITGVNDIADVNIDKEKNGLLYNNKYAEQVLTAPLVEEAIGTPSLFKGQINASGSITNVTVPAGGFYAIPYTRNTDAYGPSFTYANDKLTINEANLSLDITFNYAFKVPVSLLPLKVEYGIFKNGVAVNTKDENITSTGDKIVNFNMTGVNASVGDIFTFGVKNKGTTSKSMQFMDYARNYIEIFTEGGTQLKIPVSYLEAGVATKEYVNTTFLPSTDLPNVLAQTEVSSLADVNFDKTKSTFQLPYLNPITGQMEAVDLVSESLSYNNILIHPVAGALPFGANDIVFNTAPEELDGTLFVPTSSGIKITQPTNDIQLSARLKLIGSNIDPSHSLYVSIELLKNNAVIAQRGITFSDNAPVVSVLESLNFNADLNDLIRIRVSYYNNGNNSTLSLDGTGYIRLYNANESAIKIPNKQLQEDYYTDGSVANTTLTATNQTIVTKQVTDNIIINPHNISGRFTAARTGGGTSGELYFSIYKNGVQINEDYQYNMGAGDNFTVTPQNVRRFSVSTGDTLTVQARYVGSGTVALNNGSYSILGRKL